MSLCSLRTRMSETKLVTHIFLRLDAKTPNNSKNNLLEFNKPAESGCKESFWGIGGFPHLPGLDIISSIVAPLPANFSNFLFCTGIAKSTKINVKLKTNIFYFLILLTVSITIIISFWMYWTNFRFQCGICWILGLG